MPLGDVTDDLHIRVFVFNLVDEIEAASINVLVWELIQHIERGFYPELFTKNVGTFCADTLTKFYVFII